MTGAFTSSTVGYNVMTDITVDNELRSINDLNRNTIIAVQTTAEVAQSTAVIKARPGDKF